jgi:hypothetical protein
VHRRHAARPGQAVEVPADQRALGEDRERDPEIGQCVDDRGHQRVPALRALVDISARAERHPRREGALAGQFLAQHFADIRLDDDLGVEVTRHVEAQAGM